MKKLLIIENDVDTIDIIECMFDNTAFEVVKSLTKLPVQEIAQIKPDIIVIDYFLDNGFGNDLCLQLKADTATKHIPIILYSASHKIEQLAKDSYADAFVAKPFDMYYFLKLVGELSL